MQQRPPQGGGGTADDLRSDAQQLGNSAANRIHSEVDARKDTAINQAKSVSSAIERAAGQMDSNTPDWLKSVLRQGAQKIETFADTIEHKDSRELMRDAQDFARNNPGTFLAACAAAGFAAARILKAGGDQHENNQRTHQQSRGPGFPDGRMETPAQPQPRLASARTTGEFA